MSLHDDQLAEFCKPPPPFKGQISLINHKNCLTFPKPKQYVLPVCGIFCLWMDQQYSSYIFKFLLLKITLFIVLPIATCQSVKNDLFSVISLGYPPPSLLVTMGQMLKIGQISTTLANFFHQISSPMVSLIPFIS